MSSVYSGSFNKLCCFCRSWFERCKFYLDADVFSMSPQVTHCQALFSPTIVFSGWSHRCLLIQTFWWAVYNLEPSLLVYHSHPEGLNLGWSGKCRNEGDGDLWADRCGGALQGGMDREGPHPTSHAEIQKTPGTGTVQKLKIHTYMLLTITVNLFGSVVTANCMFWSCCFMSGQWCLLLLLTSCTTHVLVWRTCEATCQIPERYCFIWTLLAKYSR